MTVALILAGILYIFQICPTYNTITGDVIDGNNRPAYGIKEAASADDHNLIVANIVENFATGTISNAGASSVSANNMTS
jgi:hypothetical protein